MKLNATPRKLNAQPALPCLMFEALTVAANQMGAFLFERDRSGVHKRGSVVGAITGKPSPRMLLLYALKPLKLSRFFGRRFTWQR